jgi:hypothetical protein
MAAQAKARQVNNPTRKFSGLSLAKSDQSIDFHCGLAKALQLPLQQLPTRIPGQRLGKHHPLGAFERHYVRVAMRHHLDLGQFLPAS